MPTIPLIQLLKEPPARRGFVELAKFKKLIRVLPAHLRPYVTFLYYCGGRMGEAELIEWPQVDLPAGVIRLEDDPNEERGTPIRAPAFAAGEDVGADEAKERARI